MEDIFSVYRKNALGTYDELFFDDEDRCTYNEGIEAGRLLKNRSDIDEYEVDDEVFVAFAALALRYMDCDFREEDIDFYRSDEDVWLSEEYDRKMATQSILPLDLIKRGIKGEVSAEEMEMLCDQENYRIVPGRYWKLELVEGMIDKLNKGKINVNDFCSWCILMMRCCFAQAEKYKRKKKVILNGIADSFDCIAFMDPSMSQGEIRRECRSILARMRYDDYCFRYADQHKIPPFNLTGDVYVYVNWCSCGKVGEVYRMCVANHKQRTVNYFYAYNLDYSDNVAYNFLPNREFDDLFGRYYEFKVDPTLGINYERTMK
ncbi:MAG: hypothetical protein IJU10_02335 [Clostridia bacterium]|nr:hypothetical protein [Clostridia bacterium]